MRQNKQTLARIRTWTSCSDVNELHLAYSVPEHINEQIGHASDNLEISWVAISESLSSSEVSSVPFNVKLTNFLWEANKIYVEGFVICIYLQINS